MTEPERDAVVDYLVAQLKDFGGHRRKRSRKGDRLLKGVSGPWLVCWYRFR